MTTDLPSPTSGGEQPPLKVLVLKNSEWGRGDSSPGGLYGSYTGRMCCLGVLSVACGLDKKRMEHAPYPAMLLNQLRVTEVPPGLESFVAPSAVFEGIGGWGSTMAATKAATHNDSGGIGDAERLALLAPIFAEAGWALEYRPNE